MAAPAVDLRATGRNRRRLVVNRVAESGATAAAVLAIAVLGILVYSVFTRGASAITWDVFTKGPAVFGASGGGMAPAFVGTFLVGGIATLFALPIGVLPALQLSEYAPGPMGRQ